MRSQTTAFFASLGPAPAYRSGSSVHTIVRLTPSASSFLVISGTASAPAGQVRWLAPGGRFRRAVDLHEKEARRVILLLDDVEAGDARAARADPDAAVGGHFERWVESDCQIFEYMWQNRGLCKLLLEGGKSSQFFYLIDEFAERDLQIHDVVNADEAWLCTTPYFLAAAVKINGIPIASASNTVLQIGARSRTPCLNSPSILPVSTRTGSRPTSYWKPTTGTNRVSRAGRPSGKKG